MNSAAKPMEDVMFIIPTKRGRAAQSRTSDSADSGLAGTAKTPTSAGMASKEELKAMAAQMGWEPRELSYEEIQKMSSAELRFHEVWNKENLDRAFTIEQNKRTNAERMPIWNIRRAWSGGATAEESEKARAAGNEFATRFPTFARTVENAQAMVRFLEENDLDGTQVSSYVKAFHALTEQGKLQLAPAQSATEYLAQHPELHDNRVPPLIAARHQRQENTTTHVAAASAATSQGSVTRVVDYGAQKHGIPPESEKYSFKMKVRAMSANELAQRCADDPMFKAALDALD